MLGKKTRAIKFEEEIRSFLGKLKFEDIDGARDTFLINGNQVDVCGGYDNTLLVVECTMKQELGKKTIRDKIKEVRGVMPLLDRGFKEHPVYKKYKNIRYILATKNIDTRKEDIYYANENPRIYIWDDNFIAYYEDLYDKVKQYAIFNLLGEMGIRPSQQNTISVPAFLTTFEKMKMYNFMIDPRNLLEVSYVARRESKNERFYQRIIKKDKIAKIAKYVNDKNILPNNLIIAFGEHLRKHIRFHVLKDNYIGDCTTGFGIQYGILEFPRDYRSCWIVDGQHRLYAFVNIDKYFYNMPVTAFENLDMEKQCKIFLDINKNQKPVPADLVWDLNGDMIPSEEDGIISNVVKSLNNSGSLYHKIYIPSKGIKKKSGLLKMAGTSLSIKKAKLCRETTASKIANPFYNEDPNKVDKVVSNLSTNLSKYFCYVEKLWPEDWKLGSKGFVLDDGGNAVMVRLFEKIVSRCVTKKIGIPSEKDYETYLRPLAKLFITQYKDKEKHRELRRLSASEAGKDDILKQFIRYIQQETGDSLFGGEIESPKANELRMLEGKLKELIKNVLSKQKGNDWFIKSLPESISKKALKNMEKHGETDPAKAYLHIIFGECIAIMRQYKNFFYPIFKNKEYGFGSDIEVEGALNFLSRYKATQTSHEVGIERKSEDDALFEIYFGKINKCIDVNLPATVG